MPLTKHKCACLHSVLIWLTFIGMNGDLAACLGRKRSLHKYLEIRVSAVVTRQNAARVFITGRGLPARIANPWAVARCFARWVFNLNSLNEKQYPNITSILTLWKNKTFSVEVINYNVIQCKHHTNIPKFWPAGDFSLTLIPNQ